LVSEEAVVEFIIRLLELEMIHEKKRRNENELWFRFLVLFVLESSKREWLENHSGVTFSIGAHEKHHQYVPKPCVIHFRLKPQ
jgi:hypothetical protein